MAKQKRSNGDETKERDSGEKEKNVAKGIVLYSFVLSIVRTTWTGTAADFAAIHINDRKHHKKNLQSILVSCC